MLSFFLLYGIIIHSEKCQKGGNRYNMKNIVAGILAHVDAGKTTLSEAMLQYSGVIEELGRVDNKDSYLDTFYLERKRGITIFSKQARMSFGDMNLTLLDTPGHVDFSAEMERTLSVLDYAILVISGTEAIASHTKTLFGLLEKYHIPTFIFINKTDMATYIKEDIYAAVRRELSDRCVDFTDILSDETREHIAMSDEKVMNQYFDTGEIDDENIRQLIIERKIFPCYFGSALKADRVDKFMEGFDHFAMEKQFGTEFSAVVYKISRDNKNTRLTHLRILGGSLKVKDVIADYGEKVNQIRLYSGEKYETVNEATAGQICAVTGIESSKVQDVYGAENGQFVKPVLEPFMTYRLTFAGNVNMLEALENTRQLEEEIPEINVSWNEVTKTISIKVMGEVQTEILKELLKDRYGYEVEFGTGIITYKETIAYATEGVGHFEPLRHYAEVHLLMEPLERGSGVQFDTDVSVDLLATNWQRLILTHLYEKTHIGVLTGSPITDIKVTLVAGKAHIKHTEGGDMRQATYRALRQGLMKAESVLLEPYFDFTIVLPKNLVGRAMTELEQRFAKFDITKNDMDTSTIEGYGPVSTLTDYMWEIKAYTKGLGEIDFRFRGYDVCHNAQEVIEEKGYFPETDLANTADSVFCTHGAGYVVPWNEVEEHMHLPLVTAKKTVPTAKIEIVNMPSKKKEIQDGYAAEKELEEIFTRTYGVKKENQKKAKSSLMRTKPEKPYEYKPIQRKEKYLLVDGYNVIFAWTELSELAKVNLDAARDKLIDILQNYQGYKGIHLMIVFDAYKVKGFGGEITMFGDVSVVFTKEACTADQYIERFAHDYGKKYDITVATSDGLEQVIILGQGCQLISSREFEKEVEHVNQLIRENL